MQYVRIGRSWKECQKAGMLDDAIYDVKYQLLYNLMHVHNVFCGKDVYLKSPASVLDNLFVYGRSKDDTVSNRMKPFVAISKRLYDISNGIKDNASNEAKQLSLRQMDLLEGELIAAIAHVE